MFPRMMTHIFVQKVEAVLDVQLCDLPLVVDLTHNLFCFLLDLGEEKTRTVNLEVEIDYHHGAGLEGCYLFVRSGLREEDLVHEVKQ